MWTPCPARRMASENSGMGQSRCRVFSPPAVAVQINKMFAFCFWRRGSDHPILSLLQCVHLSAYYCTCSTYSSRSGGSASCCPPARTAARTTAPQTAARAGAAAPVQSGASRPRQSSRACSTPSGQLVVVAFAAACASRTRDGGGGAKRARLASTPSQMGPRPRTLLARRRCSSGARPLESGVPAGVALAAMVILRLPAKPPARSSSPDAVVTPPVLTRCNGKTRWTVPLPNVEELPTNVARPWSRSAPARASASLLSVRRVALSHPMFLTFVSVVA